MKVELLEEMILLMPETEFEAQWLKEQRGTTVNLDWFDDRDGDKENLEACGIHLKEKKDE